MELLLFVGFVSIILGAIAYASFVSRGKPRNPADVVTGTNKPNDRNAFGPAAADGQASLPQDERHAQR